MQGLYDNIKSDHKTKKDSRMGVIITILLCAFLLAVIFAVWFLGYHRRFTKFVGNLSASTTYAYDNDCLTAEVNGETFKVSAENMYGIFGYLSLNKSGRESSKIPEGNPVILDYGNGTMMKLWDTSADDGRHHLFIQYTDSSGKTYSYISYKTTLETVVVRYLTYGNDKI